MPVFSRIIPGKTAQSLYHQNKHAKEKKSLYTSIPSVPLSAVIRARRLALNLTQEEVAVAVGWIRPEMVGLIEAGRRRPGLDRIPALAEALQLEPFELCQIALAEYPALYAAIFGPMPLRKRS